MTWLLAAGLSWALLAVLAGVLIGRLIHVADVEEGAEAARTGPGPDPAAAPPDVTAPRAVR